MPRPVASEAKEHAASLQRTSKPVTRSIAQPAVAGAAATTVVNPTAEHAVGVATTGETMMGRDRGGMFELGVAEETPAVVGSLVPRPAPVTGNVAADTTVQHAGVAVSRSVLHAAPEGTDYVADTTEHQVAVTLTGEAMMGRDRGAGLDFGTAEHRPTPTSDSTTDAAVAATTATATSKASRLARGVTSAAGAKVPAPSLLQPARGAHADPMQDLLGVTPPERTTSTATVTATPRSPGDPVADTSPHLPSPTAAPRAAALAGDVTAAAAVVAVAAVKAPAAPLVITPTERHTPPNGSPLVFLTPAAGGDLFSPAQGSPAQTQASNAPAAAAAVSTAQQPPPAAAAAAEEDEWDAANIAFQRSHPAAAPPVAAATAAAPTAAAATHAAKPHPHHHEHARPTPLQLPQDAADAGGALAAAPLGDDAAAATAAPVNPALMLRWQVAQRSLLAEAELVTGPVPEDDSLCAILCGCVWKESNAERDMPLLVLLGKTELHPTNANHTLLMRSIRTALHTLSGGRAEDPLPSYLDIGFQSNNPANDLRGTGMFGLLQLYYLLQRHRDLAASLWSDARSGSHGFLFAVAAFNMTSLVLNAITRGKLNPYVDEREQAITAMRAGAATTTDSAWGTTPLRGGGGGGGGGGGVTEQPRPDSVVTLNVGPLERGVVLLQFAHDLYAGIFRYFSHLWRAAPQRSAADFPAIKVAIHRLLLQDPIALMFSSPPVPMGQPTMGGATPGPDSAQRGVSASASAAAVSRDARRGGTKQRAATAPAAAPAPAASATGAVHTPRDQVRGGAADGSGFSSF